MTVQEYCQRREGMLWNEYDTKYVVAHINEIEKLAQECIRAVSACNPKVEAPAEPAKKPKSPERVGKEACNG